MKIAITSLGESTESPIDQRFGRARYFIIFNAATGDWYIEDNQPNIEASKGAGILAAQRLIDLGIQVIITGHCGPKAFALLSNAEIEIYQGASGMVQNAIKAFANKRLEKSSEASVNSGYGLKGK